ncbi:MAG: hypothetical protein HS112_03835 [Zoogloeaceae bacterium]|nr:hypothetical protein [Zoogloeaceae bacterium]
MDRSKTQMLYRRYPRLYRRAALPATHTCMCWGFSCGGGWFDLIDRLSMKLETEIERQQCAGVPEEGWIAAEQVKEKFGTLRFYLSHYPDNDEVARARIEKAIDSAEEESARTCERCGGPGELREGGWMHVLCGPCELEYQRRGLRGDDGTW